jgi:transposase
MNLPRQTLEKMSKSELIALVLAQGEQIKAQAKQIKAQSEQIKTQAERIKTLESRVEELERKAAKTATPFSKKKKKSSPKGPGRQAGKGRFEMRKAPLLEEMSEIQEVYSDEMVCACGGKLEHEGFELVSVTDIAAIPKVEVRGYRIEMKCCKCCKKRYRGRHRDVGEDQYGATAHRLGPRILSEAHSLHYNHGITQRKVPAVLKELTGIYITQGLLAQNAVKQGGELGNVGKAAAAIGGSIEHSQRVHTDDTGWTIGGNGAFLMGFESEHEVFYQIRRQHRNEEVREVIPSHYQGVMNTDRGKSYDATELLGVKQQKCLSHIQRNLTDVEETKIGKVKWFTAELKRLLRAANELWHEQQDKKISQEEYLAKGVKLNEQITYHLRDRTLKDADNQRMLNQLGAHHDRGNLLRFLEDPLIEPTNNRAERALRAAVIARKVSQCSKNERGANAHAAFTSIIKTLRKRGQDVIEGLMFVMQTGEMPDFKPV